jgi:hypothetical protein
MLPGLDKMEIPVSLWAEHESLGWKELPMKMRRLVRTLALGASLIMISSGVARAWDVTINGRPTSDLDHAMSVAVDPQTGNTFVAGRRQISPTNNQFFVVKFTSAGH